MPQPYAEPRHGHVYSYFSASLASTAATSGFFCALGPTGAGWLKDTDSLFRLSSFHPPMSDTSHGSSRESAGEKRSTRVAAPNPTIAIPDGGFHAWATVAGSYGSSSPAHYTH